ncbi:hypothetical protein N480_00335 [Pseudoalteromonas luteoviolacea S2607]|uniref:hypothetical protein n=1 Tax=Pseudoalteromonas luteoviolacea TaxID=43657 RepID=UPI0007B04158|nr:hypothetical protein [Pseudoalteromonas luteoviolacea]KZN39308.1 hypothetical protein N480_00335 [Pseudoalteromonas luteoviolacea S2607]
MELENLLSKLEQIQDDGAFVFIKWDGERSQKKKTVLIEKPGADFFFRRDTDDLFSTIRDGINEYNAFFCTSI